MELPLTGRCSFDFTWIATKLDAGRRGKCQLHPSIFYQKSYLKISLQFLAGHMQISVTHCRSYNVARNGVNETGICNSSL
jgi:hypothetical protein